MKVFRILCGLGMIFCSLSASTRQVDADIVTYEVDLMANSTISGHPLRVAGKIIADTNTNMISNSNLSFYHIGDFVGTFPSFPQDMMGTEGVDWRWNADEEFLRFERLSNNNGYLGWSGNLGQILNYEFRLGSGSNPHILGYGNPGLFDTDVAVILADSGPDNPGFAVGVAVPEPSSLVCLAMGIALVGGARRRRRNRHH